MAIENSSRYAVPGLPVLVDITASALSLDVSVNVWISLARFIARGIQNAKNIIVYIYRVHDYIMIEAEKSRARVRSTSILEVAKIYESQKLFASAEPLFPPATRDKVLSRLDEVMDRHFNEIVHRY